MEFTPALLETFGRMERNSDFFVAHEVRQFGRYLPDVGALIPLSAKVALACGADSKGYLPYWPAVELARQLRASIVEFAGGHVGYLTHPVEFAARLTGVLLPVANPAIAISS